MSCSHNHLQASLRIGERRSNCLASIFVQMLILRGRANSSTEFSKNQGTVIKSC